MVPPMPNLHARVLARAVQIVGGIDGLAIQLGVQPTVLSRLLRGDFPVPPDVFLKATEIVTAAGVADAAKAAAASTPAK